MKHPPSSDHFPDDVVPDAFNVTLAVLPSTFDAVVIAVIVKRVAEPGAASLLRAASADNAAR